MYITILIDGFTIGHHGPLTPGLCNLLSVCNNPDAVSVTILNDAAHGNTGPLNTLPLLLFYIAFSGDYFMAVLGDLEWKILGQKVLG